MRLRDDWERFQQNDRGIVAIGQGTVARSKQLQQELELPFPLLADARRAAYTAYGLGRVSLTREVSLASARRGMQAILTHGVSRSTDQDMLQLGGVFAVDATGVVRYAQRQLRMSDLPSNDELLAALR